MCDEPDARPPQPVLVLGSKSVQPRLLALRRRPGFACQVTREVGAVGRHLVLLQRLQPERLVDATTVVQLQGHGGFWLLDEDHVVLMHYGSDGHFLGAERAGEVAPFRAAARLARSLAQPFPSWWNGHPEYHRDPKVA